MSDPAQRSCWKCRLYSICRVREKADEAIKDALRVTHRNDSSIRPLSEGIFSTLGRICEAFEENDDA